MSVHWKLTVPCVDAEPQSCISLPHRAASHPPPHRAHLAPPQSCILLPHRAASHPPTELILLPHRAASCSPTELHLTPPPPPPPHRAASHSSVPPMLVIKHEHEHAYTSDLLCRCDESMSNTDLVLKLGSVCLQLSWECGGKWQGGRVLNRFVNGERNHKHP